VGWAKGQELFPEGLVRHGEFLTTRYFEELKDKGDGWNASIRNPSPFFKERKRAFTGTSFLAIHVRRGDYVELGDKFGPLGDDHLRVAVALLKKRGGNREKILMFADDTKAARGLLSGALSAEDLVFLEPPEGADAAESLVLMTMATSHIISNSSFSMWGALLSPHQGEVVAPDPWMKGMPTPNQLLPKKWLRTSAFFYSVSPLECS